MADPVQALKVTRDQLRKAFGDYFETIKQFERLVRLVQVVNESTGGGSTSPIADTFETVNKNLKDYNKVLTYSGTQLTQVNYAVGGGSTITKTLGYSGTKLVTVVLSGSTPSGINLIKSLGYTGDQLSSVTYS